MRYEIDTIPVWDALKAGTPCPFCLLEKRSRQAAVRYYLGPSVMVPEVRMTTNKTGFCAANLRLLAKDPNKLGLALLSHTRIQSIRAKLAQDGKALQGEATKAATKGPIEGLLGKKPLEEQITRFVEEFRKDQARCLIEEKVAADLARYAFTLVHLWQKDGEFRPAWAASPGTCLRHAPLLLEMARDQLGTAALGTFVTEYLGLLDRSLGRAEQDVLAFTQTFDSTHSHTLVGNPQGALDRALQNLAGTFPEYEDEAKARKGPLMGGVTST